MRGRGQRRARRRQRACRTGRACRACRTGRACRAVAGTPPGEIWYVPRDDEVYVYSDAATAEKGGESAGTLGPRDGWKVTQRQNGLLKGVSNTEQYEGWVREEDMVPIDKALAQSTCDPVPVVDVTLRPGQRAKLEQVPVANMQGCSSGLRVRGSDGAVLWESQPVHPLDLEFGDLQFGNFRAANASSSLLRISIRMVCWSW